MDKEVFLKKNKWAKTYFASEGLYNDWPINWSKFSEKVQEFLNKHGLTDCEMSIDSEYYTGQFCHIDLKGERPATEEEIEKRYQEALSSERAKQKIYRENKKAREAAEKATYTRLKKKYEGRT